MVPQKRVKLDAVDRPEQNSRFAASKKAELATAFKRIFSGNSLKKPT